MRQCSAVVVITLVSMLAALPSQAVLGFTKQKALNKNADEDTGDDTNPSIATDGAGRWICVWKSSDPLDDTNGYGSDILYSKSYTNGAKWTKPAPINSNPALDGGDDHDPCIATDRNGHWVVMWWGQDPGNPQDDDIFYTYSEDNGETWSDVDLVDQNGASDGYNIDKSVSFAMDADGNGVAVWENDAEIFAARSTSFGKFWSGRYPVTGTPGTGDEYTKPKVATDNNGTFIASWNHVEDYNNVRALISRSTNGGSTWSAPINLNPLSDGRDRRVELAADVNGKWIAVWPSTDSLNGSQGKSKGEPEFDIFFAKSNNGGVTWSGPARLDSSAGFDYWPHIAVDALGYWIVTWSAFDLDTGDDYDVYVSRSTDRGNSWSDAAPLNSAAASDIADDYAPCAVGDGAGNWVVVWTYDKEPDDSASDYDINVSRASFTTATLLTLTTPNGGEKWKAGKKGKIEWSSTGNPGDITIELLRNGSLQTVIQNATANDGLHKWNIPIDHPKGGGYVLRIKSLSDSNVTDDSNGTFKVK